MAMVGQICLDWILKTRILENVLMFLDIDMHEICIKAKCDVSSKLEKTHFVNRNFLMISIHTNGFWCNCKSKKVKIWLSFIQKWTLEMVTHWLQFFFLKHISSMKTFQPTCLRLFGEWEPWRGSYLKIFNNKVKMLKLYLTKICKFRRNFQITL